MSIDILTGPKTKKTIAQLRDERPDEGARFMREFEERGLLAGAPLTGLEDEMSRRLIAANHLLRKTQMVSLRPLLPLLLNLKGRPYSLSSHFPFEPFFRTRMAKSTLFKAGRQVSKSTSLAAQGVISSNCLPYFSTLYVTPLFEMIRRFSQSYVRPFIETSPVTRLFSGSTTMNSVLQRSFKNRAQMFFSFAFLNAERTRGVPADRNSIDECQDLDMSFLPIIHETMSGSPWGIRQYAGTPKSMANTMETLWGDSSQAEWVIKCHHAGCGHWNIPALSHDLVDMLGPYRSDISEAAPGIVCTQCAKPLLPRTGRWLHARPALRWDFAGYHLPQCIFPMHCCNKEKWGILKGKQEGRGNTTANAFFNEVCGESFDHGSKLVTETDLKAAAVLPWRNQIDEAEKGINRYVVRVLAVDWGGGGAKGPNGKEIISFTTMAALGLLPDGKIDVIWGHRSLTPHDHVREAKLCMGAIRRLKLAKLVHDYTGAGSTRETIVNQCGYSYENLVPVMLGRTAARGLMQLHEANESHPRNFYILDKPRGIQTVCHGIKFGSVRFFQYDYENNEQRGLMRDFLALLEEKTDSRMGGDFYSIVRDPHLSDDFAMAVTIGCCALWQMSGQWPNLSEIAKLNLDPTLMRLASPQTPDWT